jgi:hypothetical protein
MISNQTVFDLDSIRDTVDILRKSKTWGYDLKMKIELLQDRIAEFAREYMRAKENEVTPDDKTYNILVRAYEMIEDMQE